MTSKSSYFHIVLEKFDKLNNKEISELELNNYLRNNDVVQFYAFILHDKDVNVSGEIERPHYHIVVVLKNPYSSKTVLNDIVSKLFINRSCVGTRKIFDFVLMCQYLIHKNDKDKYQYDLLDIWSNDVDELFSILYDGTSQYDMDINYLIELVHCSNTLRDVYKTLGLKKSRTYRSIIVDLWKERFK